MPDYAVRNLIRQRKLEQIYSVMQTGTGRGMQTMEQSLCELVLRGTVTSEAALDSSSYPDQLLAACSNAPARHPHRVGEAVSTAGLRLAGS